MDDLPESAQAFLHATMRRNRLGVPAIANGIPLSKHVAYKLDTWWVTITTCTICTQKAQASPPRTKSQGVFAFSFDAIGQKWSH